MTVGGRPGRARTAAGERAGRTSEDAAEQPGASRAPAGRVPGPSGAAALEAGFDRVDRLLELAIQIALDHAGAAGRQTPQAGR